MKNIRILLVLTVLLTGGAAGALSWPAQAQVCAPPPFHAAGAPWVGPNTPWVYYNGDWFHNGQLHHFFGPKYGWAPYNVHPPVHVVRPAQWYGPKWQAWYQANPHHWKKFHHRHPHWRGHRAGHPYPGGYYSMHRPVHGKGWKKRYYDD
ncbi:MAG: hypothetical protein WAU47_02505 [Desulfobaccales bacterium]